MTKHVGDSQRDPARVGLPPTELPLRPLCPACGAERVALSVYQRVTFEVVAATSLADDLQVLNHRLEGCGWDDDDVACCERCGWRGHAAALRSATTSGGA